MSQRQTRGLLQISYYTKPHPNDELDDVVCAITRAQNLGIRTPSIERIVPFPNSIRSLCITQKIDGPTLEECWSRLGWFSTIKLAFQLRWMVNRMRTITSPTVATGACRAVWLEERYDVPPSATPAVLSSIINFWYNFVHGRREVSKALEQHQESCIGPTTPKKTLFFTHTDLAPKNIILEDKTHNLWIIDWDRAGFYPEYFEFAVMRNCTVSSDWGRVGELRWKLFCSISPGWYEKERMMLGRIQSKAGRFAAARRWNIKAGVTPSEASNRVNHPVD
ncbi:hypothetical protein QBC38DRAFT_367626 [Podospora fimiseda]|uniref:Aminoglycoside phosphotransferase domain-containing protein n=1 Tax=Podospora fimiseda TaxID=252190 RepID=A0AAN7BMB6_9PEZI|nr:hypothetical protein QBC38DRAFT_367626 [Podospora fimiseda]